MKTKFINFKLLLVAIFVGVLLSALSCLISTTKQLDIDVSNPCTSGSGTVCADYVTESFTVKSKNYGLPQAIYSKYTYPAYYSSQAQPLDNFHPLRLLADLSIYSAAAYLILLVAKPARPKNSKP